MTRYTRHLILETVCLMKMSSAIDKDLSVRELDAGEVATCIVDSKHDVGNAEYLARKLYKCMIMLLNFRL